jgi:hypothetical protein
LLVVAVVVITAVVVEQVVIELIQVYLSLRVQHTPLP